MSDKKRLDTIIFERGLVGSRERARTTIMSGTVYVDGRKTDKPGVSVPAGAEIEIRGNIREYVSRGGLKLQKALSEFNISPSGMTVLDVGASTGGFTDCFLKGGASKVYAVDVGYGQLDWKLRNDPRVICMERTNVRYLTPEQIPDRINFASIDVSFISLKLVLPVVHALLCGDGELVALIKPQFEAGRGKVGKKGVVREPEIHAEVLEAFLENAEAAGFFVKGLSFSPIRGPEGNIEYLAHLSKSGADSKTYDIKALVSASHSELS